MVSDPNTLTDSELAAEVQRLEERLRRDRRDYPLNWRFIGSSDKARLAECKAERTRRKAR